jgi:hypothetical protein
MTTDNATDVSWYDRLRQDYPGYVTRFPECNEGWDKVLRGFFDAVVSSGITPEQFGLAQIKEKYGDLVIYYHLNDEVTDEAGESIRAAYEAAQEASRVTCEVTGKPGVLIERGGWYLVRSPEGIQAGDNIVGPIPEGLKEEVEKALAASVPAA